MFPLKQRSILHAFFQSIKSNPVNSIRFSSMFLHLFFFFGCRRNALKMVVKFVYGAFSFSFSFGRGIKVKQSNRKKASKHRICTEYLGSFFDFPPVWNQFKVVALLFRHTHWFEMVCWYMCALVIQHAMRWIFFGWRRRKIAPNRYVTSIIDWESQCCVFWRTNFLFYLWHARHSSRNI